MHKVFMYIAIYYLFIHAMFAQAQSFPQVNIQLSELDLWGSERGIYQNPQNKGKDWERQGQFKFSDSYAGDVGIRIHGGASRTRSPKKSFRIYFRKEYSSPESKISGLDKSGYKQLVLRAGFNDTWTHDSDRQRKTATYIREQVAREIYNSMGFWVPQGIWTQLYLNNKYWGLYNLTESIHEHTLSLHFNSKEGWDIVEDGVVQSGDDKFYNETISWLKNNDLSADNDYQVFIEKYLDVKNFTHYMITNIWLQNYDWPQKNWTIFRNRDSGKWMFTLWDVEYSFGGGSQGFKTNHNTLEHATRGDFVLGKIFLALLKNRSYRLYFWQTLELVIKNYLNPENLIPIIERHSSIVKAAIPLEADRWARDKSLKDFEESIRLAKYFTQKRTQAVIRDFRYKIGDPPRDFDKKLLEGTKPRFIDGFDPFRDMIDYVF